MKIGIQGTSPVANSVVTAHSCANVRRQSAFTLVEAMASVALLSILVTTCGIGIFTMLRMAGRTADYTAITAVVEAKVQDIRSATYNPPNYPWSTNTIYITNANRVALDKSGVSFLIPGTVTSKIEPVGVSGHMVTVTGTFVSSSKPITISIQSVVNKFSGGQQ